MRHKTLVAVVGAVVLGAAPASAQLFQVDSKQLGDGKMDIVVKEVERRERSSVIEVKVNARGSSVGASFFLLCSIRQLAQLRGYHHIAKLEDRPKPEQMLVAFLDPGERPDQAAPEFQGIDAPDAVLDLDRFADICGAMK